MKFRQILLYCRVRKKTFICLVFGSFLLCLMNACAPSYTKVSIRNMRSLWTGTPETFVSIPYPEPLTFEIPAKSWVVKNVALSENNGGELILLEGVADSYVQISIHGETKAFFEEGERSAGKICNFNRPDSLFLFEFLNNDVANLRKKKDSASVEFSRINYDSKKNAAWIRCSYYYNVNFSYAVFKTKKDNIYWVKVIVHHRMDDSEEILKDVVESYKEY